MEKPQDELSGKPGIDVDNGGSEASSTSSSEAERLLRPLGGELGTVRGEARPSHVKTDPDVASSAPESSTPTFAFPSLASHAPPARSLSEENGLGLGKYTRVFVRVRTETRLGEDVRCAGASFALGQYNPSEALALVTTPDSYPVWYNRRPFVLPEGVPATYVYAIFSGGELSRWEPIASERMIVPKGVEMTIEETFGEYNESMVLTRGPDAEDTVYTRTSVDKTESQTSRPASPDRYSQSLDSSERLPPVRRKLEITPEEWEWKPQKKDKLFLVCYHLPVLLRKVDGVWQARWNLDSIFARTEDSAAEDMTVQWIGVINVSSFEDDLELESLTEEDKDAIKRCLRGMDCNPIFIDPALQALHYFGYCKKILWPILHNVDLIDIYSSVWDDGNGWTNHETSEQWEAFNKVNTVVAEAVVEISKGEGTSWIHDYHLILVPKLVREMCSAISRHPNIIFFFHVPFATSEVIRCHPYVMELLTGVLGADVVGFHTFDNARHFLNACKRFLGTPYQSRNGGMLGLDYKGRNVMMTISHVGLEDKRLSAALQQPQIEKIAAEIRKKHEGKVIIIGVDPCERLAGIVLKILAFEQLLSESPTLRSKVVLVQKCIRKKHFRLGDQNKSSNEIRALVERITDSFGPVVDYEELNYSPTLDQRLGLWLASSVYLNTSVREGLNLMPLEYVFAKETDPGIVIASEFSACTSVLNGGLRINPWNLREVVSALDKALSMSRTERMGRRNRDLKYLAGRAASAWTRRVLSDMFFAARAESLTSLEDAESEVLGSHKMRLGGSSDFQHLNLKKVVFSYMEAKRRVFLLDYGGTLVTRENIGKTMKRDFNAISGRMPTKKMRDALQKLAANPLNTVFVISGVSQINLTKVLGHIEGLGLATLDGALYSWAEGVQQTGDEGELSGTPALLFPGRGSPGRGRRRNLSSSFSESKRKSPREKDSGKRGAERERGGAVEARGDVNGTNALQVASLSASTSPPPASASASTSASATSTTVSTTQADPFSSSSSSASTGSSSNTATSVSSSSSVRDRYWSHLNLRFNWAPVRAVAEPILQSFVERTNGSTVRYLENSIAWNFRPCNPEWGIMQAKALQEELEEVLADFNVSIGRKKGILEIVPDGLHKGVVAEEILRSDASRHGSHADFVFCIGDDSADENMFKAIYEYMAKRAEQDRESCEGSERRRSDRLDHVFTCTVGKKPSHAHLFVNSVDEVEELLYALANVGETEQSSPEK